MKFTAITNPETPPSAMRLAPGRCEVRPRGLSADGARPNMRRARRGALERILLDVALPALLVYAVTHPTSQSSKDSCSSHGTSKCHAMALPPFFVGAANWAQVVGPQRQNTVTPAQGYFTPRWGHQTVLIDSSTGTETIEAMIVMGGDTLESGTQNGKAVSTHMEGLHHDGSRGFRNDIHAVSSYRWIVYRDEVEKTKYNKGMPHVEGSMEWEVICATHLFHILSSSAPASFNSRSRPSSFLARCPDSFIKLLSPWHLSLIPCTCAGFSQCLDIERWPFAAVGRDLVRMDQVRLRRVGEGQPPERLQ